MKQKLIKLSDTHYLIIDDSEIKEGEYAIHKNKEYREKYKQQPILCNKSNCLSIQEHWRKITHSTQPLEQHYSATDGTIPFVYHKIKPLSLSGIEEAINSYSIEKLAFESMIDYKPFEITCDNYKDYARYGFIKGFKAHQELVKDKDKEVIQLLTNITEWSSFKEHPIGKQAQRALDLLLPKTEWECSISDGKLVLL